MAETLFITPAELVGGTILGGNTDPDRYLSTIAFVQISVIEPMLGTKLYDKIMTDFEDDNLAGDYETIFIEFVKPITKHEALAEYVEISPYLLENGGSFKHVAENREPLSLEELKILAGKFHHMAQMFIKRFDKYICNNTIPEYDRSQDDVDAQSVEVRSGLYFGNSYKQKNWKIDESN